MENRYPVLCCWPLRSRRRRPRRRTAEKGDKLASLHASPVRTTLCAMAKSYHFVTGRRVRMAHNRPPILSSVVSALGQKQTCAVHSRTSGLPPKADIDLLDHVVGEAEDRIWDRQPDFPRGTEVDDQVELRGLFHR